MKLKKAILTTGALALATGAGFAQGKVPTGKLNVKQSIVRTGHKPAVNWRIQYPRTLNDIVSVDDPGTITINSETEVEIRVLGVAFQSGSQLLPAALQASIGNGGWNTLFNGTSEVVDPSLPVYKRVLRPGTTIDFSAVGGTRYGGWSFSANTLSASPQVTHLRNGDVPPYYTPAYSNQGTVEDYLSGYLGKSNNGHGNNVDGVDVSNPGESSGTAGSVETDANVDDEMRHGQTVVSIGPRDLLYLFELGTTNTDSSYFDMQDIAVVITFKDVED